MPLIDDVFSDRLGFDQRFRARQFAFGEFDFRLCIIELALCLLRNCFVLPRVDRVERIPRLDDGAILEIDTCDKSSDTRTDLDLLDRIEASGKFVPICHGSTCRLRDGDRWRGWSRGLLASFVIAAREKQRRKQYCCQQQFLGGALLLR